MTLIDGDKIITALLYNPQHDEFYEKKMSIIDFVNMYSDEGLTKDDDILDKIRAEIESCREDEEPHLCDYRYHRNEGLDKALEIIDKYKAESEEVEDVPVPGQ